jgi:hypothetical protein
MAYLLFGGCSNTGKTGAILRLAHSLQNRGYQVIQGTVPPLPPGQNQQDDFLALLDGVDRNGKRITIVVNSATDDLLAITKLQQFCATHKPNFVISSIRNELDQMRNNFLSCMGIVITSNDVEIPMASFHKNLSSWNQIIQWYENKIDAVTQCIIHNPPFMFV